MADNNAEQNTQVSFDFATWIQSQDEATKNGITAYVASQVDEGAKGLKTALESERSNGKALEKALKQIQGQLKDGDEASKTIEALRADLQRQTKRNAFLSSAPKDVLDMEVALTVAESKQLIGDDGAVDWDKFKAAHPVLFAQKPAEQPAPKAPPTNAGPKTPVVTQTTQELIAAMRASGAYSM